MIIEKRISQRKACRWVGLSRNALREPVAVKEKDVALQEWIRQLAKRYKHWGLLNRADFYGLCKHGRIIFVVFFASLNHRINAMDELIANRVQNQHFILALLNFSLIIILQLPAPAARP